MQNLLKSAFLMCTITMCGILYSAESSLEQSSRAFESKKIILWPIFGINASGAFGFYCKVNRETEPSLQRVVALFGLGVIDGFATTCTYNCLGSLLSNGRDNISFVKGMILFGGPFFAFSIVDFFKNRESHLSIKEEVGDFMLRYYTRNIPPFIFETDAQGVMVSQEDALKAFEAIIHVNNSRWIFITDKHSVSGEFKKRFLGKSTLLPGAEILFESPDKFYSWSRSVNNIQNVPIDLRKKVKKRFVYARLKQDFVNNLSDGKAGFDIAEAIMGFVGPNDIQIPPVGDRLEAARQRQEAKDLIEENSRKAAAWFQSMSNSDSNKAAALAKIPAACNNPARLGQTRGGIYGLPVSMLH